MDTAPYISQLLRDSFSVSQQPPPHLGTSFPLFHGMAAWPHDNQCKWDRDIEVQRWVSSFFVGNICKYTIYSNFSNSLSSPSPCISDMFRYVNFHNRVWPSWSIMVKNGLKCILNTTLFIRNRTSNTEIGRVSLPPQYIAIYWHPLMLRCRVPRQA